MINCLRECWRGGCGDPENEQRQAAEATTTDEPEPSSPSTLGRITVELEPSPGTSHDGRGDADAIGLPKHCVTITPGVKHSERRTVTVTMGEKDNLRGIAERVMATCDAFKGRYYDEEFPVGPIALFKDGEKADEEKDKDIKSKLDKVKKWLRPDQIVFQNKDWTNYGLEWTIMRNPTGCDVQQGGLGNCWFIGVLGLISARKEILDKVVVTKKMNSAGIYIINLFHEGKFQDVMIDDRLPCDEYRSLCFGRSNRMQLYVPLVEKAMAKLLGSYESLDGCTMDSAMLSLTGYPSKSVNLLGVNDDQKEGMWEILVSSLKSDSIVGAATTNDSKMEESSGLKEHHVYSVLKVCDSYGHRLIQFRNPWGSNIWKGDWHPYSWTWGTKMRKAFRPFMDGPGVFYMCLDDVVNKHFSHFQICQIPENRS